MLYGNKKCAVLSILLFFLLGDVVISLPAARAAEKKWPDKPIEIIIPSGPGSSMDRLIRGAQPYLSEELGGVPIVLINREGGNFTVGVEHAWRQPADGNTLLMFLEPMFSGVLKRKEKVFTNNLDDFAFIGGLNLDAAAILANVKRKYQNLRDVIKDLKEGKKVIMGVTAGSPAAMGVYAMADALKVKPPTYVFYKGGGELRVDALGGHLDLSSGFHDGHLPLHEGGEVKFIAFFSENRLPDLPDIPTVKEVVKEFGGSDVPVLNGFRFLAVNSKVKKDYPDRYKKLVEALHRVSQNERFIEWGKKSEFSVSWIEPDTLYQWSKAQYRLIEKYPETIMGK